MSHNRVVQLIAVLCLAGTLVGAGFIAPHIDTLRVEPQKIMGNEVAEVLPPDKAILTIMLSVFRGVAIDILWYRANSLKEEGKFYEANELSELITSLQPHFVKVWVFHSWNMAFNISVMTKTPDERWDWVNRGISLLRDRGIPLNPHATELYKELDWLFYFKIGAFSDDDNWYYKERLALEWEQALGTQPEGLNKAQTIAAFAKIADAPTTLTAVIAANPGLQVAELVDRLKAIHVDDKPLDVTNPDARLMLDRQYSDIQMFVLSPGADLAGLSLANPPQIVSADLCKLMADPTLKPAFEPLMGFVRRHVLIDEYRMDPGFMLELMKRYGPLDWRHAAAQALYWSSLGARISEENEKRTGIKRVKDVDLLNDYRGPIHCIQDLMYRGRIVFDPFTNPPRMEELPDPRFIPAYDVAYDQVKAYLQVVFPNANNQTITTFNDGHANFLQTAVQFCYLYGDIDQANFYYEKLRRLYAVKYPHRFDKTVEDFVLDNMKANMDTYFNAIQFVQAMIIQALERGLANNRPEVYDRCIKLAELAHDKWNDPREINAAHGDIGRDRQRMPPFDEYLAFVYTNYMNTPGLNPLTRAVLWNATPDVLRRRVFDSVVANARKVAKVAGLDPERAFPEPPGMAQYRKAHPIDPATAAVRNSVSDPFQTSHIERQ